MLKSVLKKSVIVVLLLVSGLCFGQNRDSLFSSGMADYEKGLFYMAIAKFENVLALDSTDSESYNAIGLAQYKMKKYGLAQRNFEHAVEVNPNNAKAFYNIGVVHFKEERYQAAKNAFDDAIGLDEDQVDFYYNRGLANERISDTTAAINDFKKCLQFNAEDDQALLKIAKWEYEMGEYQASVEHATKSQELGNKKAQKIVKKANRALLIQSVQIPEELLEEDKIKSKE